MSVDPNGIVVMEVRPMLMWIVVMTEVEKSIEVLYKAKYGQADRLDPSTIQKFVIESAEDIVQETFAEATESWTRRGVPENPAGWLYQTCRNKSINRLKNLERG